MTYKIQIEKSALKALDKIEKKTQTKIRQKISELAHSPRPFGSKKLVDRDELIRIKVNNYRIIYKIFDGILIVSVLRIAKRNERTY